MRRRTSTGTASGWTRSTAAAVPLWQQVAADRPVQKLAAFENGAQHRLERRTHDVRCRRERRASTISACGRRSGSRVRGPSPVPWLDCSAFAEPYVPTCYSPFQHPQLASDDGRTFVLTLTRFRIYDVVAYEVRLGTPIHEFRSEDGQVAYAPASFAIGWSDEGVAFYASDVPLDGFAGVYAWQRGNETRFAVESPGDGFSQERVAFYAPTAPKAGTSITPYRPVYEWTSGSTTRLSRRDLTVRRLHARRDRLLRAVRRYRCSRPIRRIWSKIRRSSATGSGWSSTRMSIL